MNEENLRLFIGIFFDHQTLREIKKAAHPLEKYFEPRLLRWVPWEQLHITLRFLGSTDKNRLPLIENKLTQITQRMKGFDLELKNFLYFPSEKKPRILALATDLPSPLSEMVAQLEKAMVELNYTPEARSFKSHITLARFRRSRLPPLESLLPMNKIIPIEEIWLMKSQTLSSGPQYHCLARFPLLPK